MSLVPESFTIEAPLSAPEHYFEIWKSKQSSKVQKEFSEINELCHAAFISGWKANNEFLNPGVAS